MLYKTKYLFQGSVTVYKLKKLFCSRKIIDHAKDKIILFCSTFRPVIQCTYNTGQHSMHHCKKKTNQKSIFRRAKREKHYYVRGNPGLSVPENSLAHLSVVRTMVLFFSRLGVWPHHLLCWAVGRGKAHRLKSAAYRRCIGYIRERNSGQLGRDFEAHTKTVCRGQMRKKTVSKKHITCTACNLANSDFFFVVLFRNFEQTRPGARAFQNLTPNFPLLSSS